MQKVYRLKSGKVSRKNEEGVNETHKSPYDFVPTESEYQLNKFRLQYLGEIPDTADRNSTAVATALAELPAEPAPVEICRMDVKTATAHIATALSEEELDGLLLQEADNKPKVRKTIILAIEQRRKELTNHPDAAQGQIRLSEILES